MYRPSAAANFLQNRWGSLPHAGVITGSGFVYHPENSHEIDRLPYAMVPGLSAGSVSGHASEIRLYEIDAKRVVVCSGRLHLYEGYAENVCMQLVYLMHDLQVSLLMITNAAGGLHWRYKPGDIALITDSIDLTFMGPQPYSLSHSTSISQDEISYVELLQTCAHANLPIQSGTYCQVTGPNYETRAECRMLRRIGAELVGMSTVREMRLARQLGLKTLAFSMITNTLSDTVRRCVTHDEVLDIATLSRSTLTRLLDKCITLIDQI